jgi:hypothetical protein
MEYEPQTYFTEHEQDDVKGFTVLTADESEGYHIAEKWLKEEDEGSVWMDYWIPEAQLLSRVSDGACEPKGKLTDEQYEMVCEMVGWEYTNKGEAITA